jgi:hypothetical protein
MDEPRDVHELNAIYERATKEDGIDYFGVDVQEDSEIPVPGGGGSGHHNDD